MPPGCSSHAHQLHPLFPDPAARCCLSPVADIFHTASGIGSSPSSPISRPTARPSPARSLSGPAKCQPPGTYTTSYLVSLHDQQQNGALHAQTTVPLTLSATSSRRLPPPAVSSLDFSGGINQGRVSNRYRQATTIQGASCTGFSTRLRRRASYQGPTGILTSTSSIRTDESITSSR